MTGQLIFITGASGFIGSATALAALKRGYRLRVCLRKPSEKLQAVLSDFTQHVEYVIVPDITDETAFKGKLDGVDFVLHLASPLSRGTDKESYFIPAVKGTTALLKEAARVASIKKVVVTSSIAALIPLTGIPEGGVVKEDNDWDFSVDEAADFTDHSNPAATPMRLYHASKLLANNATWNFWKTARTHYALVTIHPAFVYGHNLVQTSAEEVMSSSNGGLWKTIMDGVPVTRVTGVHIQDVADAHIKTLDPKIVDGSKYLLSGKKATWSEVAEIVQRSYPDAGAKITLDVEGESMPTDTSKAEGELEIQWRPLEEMVQEVMDQQLGFVKY